MHKMGTPKYQAGQIVYFDAAAMKRGAPGGAHRVERHLPPDLGQHQYRVKAVGTGHERVAGEGQLSTRITVEALAQSLYEKDNTSSVPWARRDRIVRDAWLKEAVARLAAAEAT